MEVAHVPRLPARQPPIELPGVVLAALASIGLGAVIGPEAPLIALGGGLGFLTFKLLRRDGPPQIGLLLASASTFAAVSFLFGSPVIAAVLLIEAAGLGGPMLPLVLVPGLTAAGIGSLVSIGLGQWKCRQQGCQRTARDCRGRRGRHDLGRAC